MAVVLELALDAEQVVLGVVDQHEPPRRDARDLAAQLRADRAARAGDEHDLAARGRRRRGRAPSDRLAAEDVLDLHLADLADHRARRRLQQLEDRRQRADRDPAVGGRAHDPRAQRAGRGRDRDRDLVGLGLVEDPRRGPPSGRQDPCTPSTRMPRLSGSSSTKPTGFRPSSGLRRISRRTSRPPSPAPTISTRRASAARGSRAAGARRPMRATKRTPPTSASSSRQNRTSTPVGGVTATSPLVDGTVTGLTRAMRPASASVVTTTACTSAT